MNLQTVVLATLMSAAPWRRDRLETIAFVQDERPGAVLQGVARSLPGRMRPRHGGRHGKPED